MSVNKVILIGNLGQDPEDKYTTNGTLVARFSIATTETWRDRETREKKEQTEWHKVVCYRKLAEICSNYLKKGDKVYLEGKLASRSWEQDGQKKYITEVILKEMRMLGTRKQGEYNIPDNQIGNDDIPF